MDTQTEMQSQQQSGPTYLQKRPCAHGLHEVELPCDEKKPKNRTEIYRICGFKLEISTYTNASISVDFKGTCSNFLR